jgi:bifunctional DNA-binding transcriptional regulator/antitoxin component of YhaV-PrlF toxin-antitoxin module
MLAKMTSKNQITIPRRIAKLFPAVYFDVKAEPDRIILTPVSTTTADQIREKLAEMGIDEQDVRDAVEWARK